MSKQISSEDLGPVIAVALDKAWGDRYGEHAAEELETEGKSIAKAVLGRFIVTAREVIPVVTGDPDVTGLPVYTVLKVYWGAERGFSVLRKIKGKSTGHTNAVWEVVSDNSENTFADWEIEVIAASVEIVALGVTLE